ncbi:MAG TPA: hypothetical protein VGE29_22595 [Prosthecobacter sp.]
MNLLHLDLPLVARVNSSAATTSNSRPWPDTAATSQEVTSAQRLQELEDEWTIEGLFETSAAVVGVGTLALGLMVDDRWLVLPLVISVLLLQQTLQGWCPLLPLLRGLGFRTEREVHVERDELRKMEERAGFECPIWIKTESPSLPSASAAQERFSLQDFLVGTARQQRC